MLNLPTHNSRPVRRNTTAAGNDDTTTYIEYHDTEYDGGGVDQKKNTQMIDLMAMAKPAKVKGNGCLASTLK